MISKTETSFSRLSDEMKVVIRRDYSCQAGSGLEKERVLG